MQSVKTCKSKNMYFAYVVYNNFVIFDKKGQIAENFGLTRPKGQ